MIKHITQLCAVATIVKRKCFNVKKELPAHVVVIRKNQNKQMNTLIVTAPPGEGNTRESRQGDWGPDTCITTNSATCVVSTGSHTYT